MFVRTGTTPVTASGLPRGWAMASRLSSYSATTFNGRRLKGVLNWLFRIKSAYKKPEAKCGMFFESNTSALVIPFGAKIHGGVMTIVVAVGVAPPVVPTVAPFGLLQPWPSPGTLMVMVTGVVIGGVTGTGTIGIWITLLPVVAATAKALDCKMASGRFHFVAANEAVAVHQGKGWSFAEACAPKA